MVDAVVSFAVQKLGDALLSQTYFLVGVRNQVQGLRHELRRMQCFLKDADSGKQQRDELVRNWVAEIRELAYDVEDVIDIYMFKVDSTPKTQGIRNFVSRKASMIKNLVHLYKVGDEILAIQARLKAISDSRVTYGIKDLGDKEASISETTQNMMQLSLRNRYPHVVDDDVIGFEIHTQTLLSELMKDEEERRVVSIFGVGGLGKTTLAKKIYRHHTITNHFECCGWSSISQQLNVKNSLTEIAKKCMTEDEFKKIEKLDETGIIENIHFYLENKRYFIVLDDVWEIGHWNNLKCAFPTGKRGSKVLLTTRKKEVAVGADRWSLHFEPRFLNKEESWELLCWKAFPRDMVKAGCYPTDLEKLGREMVHKCGGLPLAICALGGLLATKRSEIKQWELIHSDVNSYIGENGGVKEILALSYNDLPCHLKPCFLYLGLFPEDSEVSTKVLIQMWTAEGFIPHIEGKLMEDIGKHQYLAELTQRCMIQVNKESVDEWGGYESYYSICRVHDLMRDLCLSKAKEIDFLTVHNLQYCPNGDRTTSHPVTTDACRRVRRYAAYINNTDFSKRCGIYFNADCRIRTLLIEFPRIYGYEYYRLSPINFQNIKLLRVLDLHTVGDYKTNITKQVSKLIHLRYLDLGYLGYGDGISVSPSIGNLRNLQTLFLTAYRGSLPETTSKLVQLRHLFISESDGALDQKFRIENLINLQTVQPIQAGEWIRKGCFEKLSDLRRLYVNGTSRFQTDIIVDEVVRKRPSLSSSLSDAKYQIPIRSLSISTEEELPNSIFDSLSCCNNLHRLCLTGRLDVLNLHRYPQKLSKLTLRRSMLKEDPMATLQYFPTLRILNLHSWAYEGEEMVCSSEGFPQLQHLTIANLDVKEWRVEEGGMPHLKVLHINTCKELRMLPEGLRFITTLEKLKIINMPSVAGRVKEGGEDWYKIQHIPSIYAAGGE